MNVHIQTHMHCTCENTHTQENGELSLNDWDISKLREFSNHQNYKSTEEDNKNNSFIKCKLLKDPSSKLITFNQEAAILEIAW